MSIRRELAQVRDVVALGDGEAGRVGVRVVDVRLDAIEALLGAHRDPGLDHRGDLGVVDVQVLLVGVSTLRAPEGRRGKLRVVGAVGLRSADLDVADDLLAERVQRGDVRGRVVEPVDVVDERIRGRRALVGRVPGPHVAGARGDDLMVDLPLPRQDARRRPPPSGGRGVGAAGLRAVAAAGCVEYGRIGGVASVGGVLGRRGVLRDATLHARARFVAAVGAPRRGAGAPTSEQGDAPRDDPQGVLETHRPIASRSAARRNYVTGVCLITP